MRSSLVVRASDCQCTSCNGPGLDPSIRRHSGIWGAADEAVLNIVHWFAPSSPPPPPPTQPSANIALLATILFSFLVFILSVWQVEVTHDITNARSYCSCMDRNKLWGMGKPFSIKNFFILTTCKSGKVLSAQFKRAGHSIRSYKLKYREYTLVYFSQWQS